MNENLLNILLNNENILNNAEGRRFYTEQLFRSAKDSPFVEMYADNWRFRPKGDFANLYADLVQGGLQARDRLIQGVKKDLPENFLMRYAGGTEEIKPPQVNRVSILRGTSNVPIGFANDIIPDWTIGQTLRQGSDILFKNAINFANKVSPYLMIYEGLSQPVASQQREWDDYNRWQIQNSANPILQGGIQYNE